MAEASYEIWVSTPVGAFVAVVAGSGEAGLVFSRLHDERVENQVTSLTLTLPYQDGLLALFPLDTRLTVYRNGILQGETQWFVRQPPKVISDDAGAILVEVRALCALYLLSGRIVAYAAGSSQAVKSGPADDLIKAIVRENLGSSALSGRDLSAYLDVQADTSAGATTYKTMPRRNVLMVCQELARASAQGGTPLYFDVVWTGTRLEFRTYASRRGADHRMSSAAPVVLAPEFGTLGETRRWYDHEDEATVVYCAGQGTGNERLIVSVNDVARRDVTPFNRRETFVDARYLALTDSLTTEADGTLYRRRPRQRLIGVAIDTSAVQWGTHWGWGDECAAEFGGEVVSVRVHRVEVTVAAGVERVEVELRADSIDEQDAVREIAGVLDADAPNELPVFATSPTDGAVPRAAVGATTIADGWLSTNIARAADLTWTAITGKPATFTPSAHASSHQHGGGDALATATPAANAIPKASAAGWLDSWLSTAIARLTDLTWSNVTGKPATFTPSAHASAHQHGGGDQVATATPAANAIPKASAAGWLDSWLSTAIARLTDLTWSNVTGKPSSFTPSAHASSHQHGGGDQVATATPAANAIPKASAGGWLDSWLSTAIARLTDLTWSNVSGKPATFTPSVHASTHASGGGDALTLVATVVTYTTAADPAIDTVAEALDKLLYVAPQITSLTNNRNTLEKGVTVTSVVLTWVYNKTMVTASFNQGIGSISAALLTYTHNQSFTTDRTYTLTAGDGTNTTNRSTSVQFWQKRHWGTSALTSLTSAQILALASNELATSRVQTRTMDGGGQYLYFAYPAAWGAASFTVNGLPNTAWTQATVSHTNASGFTEDYYTYRSNDVQYGSGLVIGVS